MFSATTTKHPARVAFWLVFVLSLGLLAYGARLTDVDTPDDIAYRYSSSVAALVQYGFMLGILLLIARGLPKREMFALRRPQSWRRAVGLAVLSLLAIYGVALVYEQVLSLLGDFDPTEEQGLVPDGWDSSRAGAFVAFFLVVTFVAPAVEELTFRGLGMSLLVPWGIVPAILATGIIFGGVHGLIVGFPVLAFFGIVVGFLRARTNSVYPPMILHSTFNGVALLASVTVAS